MPRTPRETTPTTLTARRTHAQISYDLVPLRQSGSRMANFLFDVLNAVHDGGSIAHAARSLGCSYRHAWGLLKEWEAELGGELIVWTRGQPARLTEFGQRLIWAERRARTRIQPHIEALRADLERMLLEARDQDQQVMTVYASHDLALQELVRTAARTEAVHLDVRFDSSVDSLRALNAGRCLVAGFHVPALRGAAPVFSAALKPLLRPGTHKLIGCFRRQQGLMLRKEHAGQIHTLGDVIRQGRRFVNRQQGSGTRLLLDHLIAEHHLDANALSSQVAHVEESHVAVAASIASGLADVGLGIRAAAVEFGLHFVPLIEDDYFLVCLKPQLTHPAVTRLCSVLASAQWRAQVTAMPGYLPANAPGKILVMTAALPWWRYRQRKSESPSRHPNDTAAAPATDSA